MVLKKKKNEFYNFIMAFHTVVTEISYLMEWDGNMNITKLSKVTKELIRISFSYSKLKSSWHCAVR